MITELRQTLTKTEKEAQYDAAAKCLLGEKIILAHILIRTIDEFKGMTADEVVLLIEGEPYIGQVPVEPGATNQKIEYGSTRITGMNTENAEMNEGTTFFDIIFYVRMRNGRSKIIINVEAQRKEPDKYRIINRAIFYVGRMISSQKEREFTGMNYDVEKEVSIMCNLSQGIKEESEAKGEEKARTEIVLNVHKKGYSLDQIVEITNLDVSAVKAIIG